jgi:hypothetical protein
LELVLSSPSRAADVRTAEILPVAAAAPAARALVLSAVLNIVKVI